MDNLTDLSLRPALVSDLFAFMRQRVPSQEWYRALPLDRRRIFQEDLRAAERSALAELAALAKAEKRSQTRATRCAARRAAHAAVAAAESIIRASRA